MRHLGRYLLEGVIGSGAFATVWKGFDPELDTVVAVKVLADNWALNADVRERFLAEARLLRRIDSPRVVRVHDVGVAEDRPYFVMDHIDGGTLADLVGQVPADEAIRLAAEAASAVQVLHDAGVVHRDLKPSNVLVDRTGDRARVLVADLGSAKSLADVSGITVTTGTPAYMAPEQAGAMGGFDGRADVYALAVVSYELLSGRRPFPELSGTELLTRTADLQPGPVAAELGLPAAVDALFRSALDPDPAHRPADPAAFAGSLLAAADGRRATAPPQPGRRAGQWPVPLVVFGAATVFVVAALISWLLR